jgi:putative copper export protein
VLASGLDALRLTLHVLSASVWVGGQIVLGGLVGPSRSLGPEAPRALARAFARLAHRGVAPGGVGRAVSVAGDWV